jgi:beta-N-acetylhexosaminidase
LEMGGILKFLPIEEAAIAAIRAGMDLLEICHSPELILRAYESLLAEAERSIAFRKVLLARASKTAFKRKRLFSGNISRALSPSQLESLRSRIMRFSEAVSKAQTSQEEHPS